MAGITLAQAEEKLTYWMTIEGQLGPNESVTINGTTFKRHQLQDIQKQITYWNRMVQTLNRSAGVRVRQVVPL